MVLAMPAAFSVGSILGIPVKLHSSFPLVLLASVLSGGQSPAFLGYAFLLYGPILLATVLAHELGHCLATQRLGGHAHSILLWPLGGLAFVGHSSGPKADLLIALAGPATHLPQFAFWYLPLGLLCGTWSLGIPSPSAHFMQAVLAGACQLNLQLAAFNLLLPAYPLDGGRIFADSMLLAGVAADTAARVTAGVATAIGAGVVGLGLWQGSVITALVGVWMLFTTAQLVKCIRDGTLEQHPMFCYEEPPPEVEAPPPEPYKGAGYQGFGRQ